MPRQSGFCVSPRSGHISTGVTSGITKLGVELQHLHPAMPTSAAIPTRRGASANAAPKSIASTAASGSLYFLEAATPADVPIDLVISASMGRCLNRLEPVRSELLTTSSRISRTIDRRRPAMSPAVRIPARTDPVSAFPDGRHDPQLDAICRTAAALFGVRYAFVSHLSADCQLFLGREGLRAHYARGAARTAGCPGHLA